MSQPLAMFGVPQPSAIVAAFRPTLLGPGDEDWVASTIRDVDEEVMAID